MRVNIYAEEMTDRVEIVKKGEFTGIRFYLYLPVTVSEGISQQIRGPFIHHPGDDDSSAITFWGKEQLLEILPKALELLKR